MQKKILIETKILALKVIERLDLLGLTEIHFVNLFEIDVCDRLVFKDVI